MSTVTRRSLLAGAAALPVLAQTPAAARKPVPVTREEHRLVIIGSGFGGGVAALRFAQAGVPSLVLERGVWWRTGPNATTFPSPANLDKRAFWMGLVPPTLFGVPVRPHDPYTGLLEMVPGDGMNVVCAAGVGGGSLVYQGMTLQPTRELFETTMPEGLDYQRMVSEYYPRVARMLRLRTAPDDVIASRTYLPSRIFKRNAERAGYAVAKIPMPIDWNFARRELAGEMRPSYTNGDCALGVNNGGKHSVDVTYLADALATGLVTVAPRHNVTRVALARDGRWTVHVDRIATDGTVLAKKILTTRGLVMAAGTVNTTRLLMRAAARGDIPDLPDGLGTNWGTNGDRIYVWTNFAEDFGAPQGGPVVYGSKDWADPATANTVIQASLPPLPVNPRSTMLVGYGVSEARGRFVYDAAKDDAVLHWPKPGDSVLFAHLQRRAEKIAGRSSLLLDTNAVVPSTWHPLGGASMGTVCDLAGRVLGHRGLYVLDGALAPGTTAACNPSMTIAALAEQATTRLVASDVGTIF
ncbi:GMC oxidoreductase [Actinocorallia sp. API 0066]|uniref:GMC oxidoreductase n=1 Tax=Actinocorallia sp. API 0066 TaxID=2896846 RepID=UPI001E3185CF|nr:GMC oxidoreductase [Actinocorallia sp. API 0066]MCD0449240.1 GMC oxidoreductase [Actinocorallia sp. API 0066]